MRVPTVKLNAVEYQLCLAGLFVSREHVMHDRLRQRNLSIELTSAYHDDESELLHERYPRIRVGVQPLVWH